MGHELTQRKEPSAAAVNDNSRMHALVVETFGHLVSEAIEEGAEAAGIEDGAGIGWSDYVSVLKLVGEHAGLDLEAALPTVAKAVTVGAETADIVLAGLEFQCEGLEAIDDAHQRGERDNRIYLYADAWAEGFLEGAYENAGAVDASQRQAVANGLREGKATAGRLGPRAKEVGQTLLDKDWNVGRARHNAASIACVTAFSTGASDLLSTVVWRADSAFARVQTAPARASRRALIGDWRAAAATGYLSR